MENLVIVLSSLCSLLFGILITLILTYIKQTGVLATVSTNMTNIKDEMVNLKAEVKAFENRPTQLCPLHNGQAEALTRIETNVDTLMRDKENDKHT